MALAPDVLTRILIGIIVESVVFAACCAIITIILVRYRKNKKAQLGSMAGFFILYALAIAASIMGKILTYVSKSFKLDHTEWGVFTNWSLSLAFISISLYYQLEVAWQLFPPKTKNPTLFARMGSALLVFIIFAIPRYGINDQYGIDEQEVSIYPIKFILVFIYVLAASLYYMIKSYKVYTFLRSKFLRRRILAGLVMYTSIILVFVFFMVSSIYGAITTEYYTWGYFISVTFMLSAAIAGYFYVKHGNESDRQEIDEELAKLLQEQKNEKKKK